MIFQKINKFWTAGMLAFLLILTVLLPTGQAYAAGTVQLAFSNSNPSVGDTVTVTITDSVAEDITVAYTASVITLSESSANYTGGDGKISFNNKSMTLKMKASAAGKANVIVSVGGVAQQSAVLNVLEAAAAQPEEAAQDATPDTTDEAPAETAAPAASGSVVGTASDKGFNIGGVEYVVSERYTDAEIPAGFTRTPVNIGGASFREISNGTITLVYLKPADNIQGSGVFYLYDPNANTVASFAYLGSGSQLVILSAPDSLPSSLLTETTITVGERTVQAYQYGTEANGFYYVYGTGADGSLGWFSYDSTSDSIQKANTDLFAANAPVVSDEEEPVAEDTDTEEEKTDSSMTGRFFDKLRIKSDNYRMIICVLVVVCLILLILLINTLVSRHNLRKLYEGNEGEDSWDDWKDEEKDDVEDISAKLVEAMNSETNDVAEDRKEQLSVKPVKEVEKQNDEEPSEESEEEDEEEVPKKKRGLFRHRKDDFWDDEDDEEDGEEDEEEAKKEAPVQKKNTRPHDDDSDSSGTDFIDLNNL